MNAPEVGAARGHAFSGRGVGRRGLGHRLEATAPVATLTFVEAITPNDEQALGELRDSLLRRRRPDVESGEEAFDQHLLLAIALHRVSRLHKSSGESDTKGWIRYVTDFFPSGHNGEAEAFVLWDQWRCTLLKDEQPVIPISHGQSHGHFRYDSHGRLYLNLEDLWVDYEHSVERFIEHLREDEDRREVALERWRKRAWQVETVTFADEPSTEYATTTASITPPLVADTTASVATSMTSIQLGPDS